LLISSIHIINYPTVSAAVGGIGRILNMGYRERARRRADGTSSSFSVGVGALWIGGLPKEFHRTQLPKDFFPILPFGSQQMQRKYSIGMHSYSSVPWNAGLKKYRNRKNRGIV